MAAITADNLNSVIEFDSPFTVAPGNNVFQPLFGIYAPSVFHSEENDIEIDSSDWSAFSVGYTGQFGYNGAVMHASETLSSGLAEDILSTPGTYVVCAVEVYCDDAEDYTCDPAMDCGGHEPAGWVVLKLS